jgi:hypothetical protein
MEAIQQNATIPIQTSSYNEPAASTFLLQLEQRIVQPSLTTEKLKELYIESLTPKEHKAYLIAKSHLGMSFTLEKSVGFIEWKKTFVQ